MSSRMSKYYDEPDIAKNSNSRLSRNEKLYKEISKSELNSYDVKSNATVLGDNKNEIDVEKIKKILDNKYNETPKRKSIRLENTEEVKEERETTKEYDINVILEKAREEKQENYEEERLKKLRDTQFDILKKLNIEKNEIKEEDNKEKDLEELINTIALNEKQNKGKNDAVDSALDILSDLKGSDNTETLNGLKEEITNKEKEESIENEVKDDELSDTKMVDSFYTSSNALKEKDFEDMEDFSKEIESNNIFIKIFIAIIVIVFIIGIVLIIKTFMS